MNELINKIIAFGIGISIMTADIIPAFALDTMQNTATPNIQVQANEKTLLTLDDAIKAAIGNSETLALDDKKINYKDKINDLNEKIDDNPQLVGKAEIEISDDKKDLNEDTREVQLKQIKQQRDFDEDKLIQKTTIAYNNIVTSQMKIEQAQRDIELKTKELSFAKLKNDRGAITLIDLNANELKLEDLKDKLKSNENVLKDAEYNFKVLTGKDVTQYSLEQDIKYETFKIDGSVDEYLDNVIENYLKYSTQLIELNKDYLNDSGHKVADVTDKDKPSDDKPILSTDGDLNSYEEYENKLDSYYQEREMYAFKLSMRLTYLNAKISTYESETNLDETKKQFKEQLRAFYTSLITMEDNINSLKKNIILNNKQLSILKVKYDDGAITKTDYDTQVLSSENLSIQLRDSIDRYNTLKEEIQKPWIAFSK